ncbi:YoaP domain-containing protein [Mariniphaga sediminis]|jgi:hypothetical protein|uniref:YoaP domain-containing protein n=1 Tax=Mariniphaga sediminis TaxID=1628158 RepID=UPI00356AD1F3
MNKEVEIVTINQENLALYPDVICFINPKNQVFPLKIEWIKQRLSEGLRIKLIYLAGQKKAVGFIEYVPGEYAWRAVSASGYLFIHCLFVYPNKNKNLGLGTQLITECINDANLNKCKGVAVVASKGSFMAGDELFLKNGFKVIETDGAGNQLLALTFGNGTLPVINDWKSQRARYQGLHIIYSKQCPWVARFVEEIRGTETAKKLNLVITEMKTPEEAQNAPSLYSTFNLIYNGKILADRYISNTRFNNILKKEKLI